MGVRLLACPGLHNTNLSRACHVSCASPGTNISEWHLYSSACLHRIISPKTAVTYFSYFVMIVQALYAFWTSIIWYSKLNIMFQKLAVFINAPKCLFSFITQGGNKPIFWRMFSSKYYMINEVQKPRYPFCEITLSELFTAEYSLSNMFKYCFTLFCMVIPFYS